MEKGKVSGKHLMLFGVAILAVGVTAGPALVNVITDRKTSEVAARFDRQQGGGPGGMAGRMMERMAQELSLTETQKSQIQPIQEKYMPRLRSLRENTALSDDQRRAQRREIRAQMDVEIKQLLTPEQQTKYDTMQAQMRQRMQGGNR